MKEGPPTLFSRFKKTLSSHDRLGDRLCREGVITQKDLEKALALQSENGLRLGHNLIEIDAVDEKTLADFLADQYRIPCVVVDSRTIEDSAVGMISPDFMRKIQAIPVSATEKTVTLAMVDPTDQATIEEIEGRLGLKVNAVITPQSAFLKTMEEQTSEGSFAALLSMVEPEQRDAILKLFRHLTDYELVGIIAEGGFAKVFKCIQKSLDRPVAIKTLDLSKLEYESVVQQFRSEGRIIAKLDHLNIVRVIEQGQVGDILYIVMEYVEGATLNRFLKEADLKTRLDIFIQVCDALSYAHGMGILHRDIKPGNIIVDRNNVAKLLDFGIARLVDAGATKLKEEETLILGTPKYMSPEQDEGASDIDVRADVYSLGVVMFEVLTRSDLKASSEVDPCELNPELPAPLGRAIQKCLVLDREGRMKNAQTLMQFLIQLREKVFGTERVISEEFENVVSEDKKDLFEQNYEFLSVITDNDLCRTQIAEHKGMHRMLVIRDVYGTAMLEMAKMRSKVDHANLAEVLGIGEGRSNYIIIREYLAGGSLGDRIQHPARIKEEQAIRLMKAMVQGLKEAAGYKVHHGHLHPENILFDREGVLKIADFGVPFSGEPKLRRFFDKGPRDPFAHDRFSLGTIFFEMIAGRQYFPGQGPDENIRHLETIDIDPPGIKVIIRKLWGIVPAEQRYSDYAQVLYDLENIPRAERNRRRVKSVFDLEQPDDASGKSAGRSTPDKPKKKTTEKEQPPANPFQRALMILILIILGVAGWFIYQNYFSGS
ncbi:MAG: protein kinase [Candidatus Omnitrophica bacterium]|nr:protein kinase [Candidatus Omnitrophota bacterium]